MGVQLGAEDVHSTALKNFQNTVFYASLSLGTPAKDFDVVIDTGSFILWVPDNVCQSEACQAHKRFSVHDSQTGEVLGEEGPNGEQYLKAGALQYGTGQMVGVQVRDTVHLAGVDIPDCGFLVATEVAREPFLQAPFDGILGIGRDEPKKDETIFNVMAAAFQQKQIAQNIISFYLSLAPT